MRVGIVTGEVAVTIGATQQGMVAGDAVNTAARVQSAATPGQVWVDETTRLLTTAAISYVDVGSHAMKGKADPVPLWAVRAVVAAVGGAQRADGLEAPLVGRDRELRLVKELFHGAEESGHPALLVVEGEAGVGKTRLGWEFEKYADGLQHARCGGTAAGAWPTARGSPTTRWPRPSGAGSSCCVRKATKHPAADEDLRACCSTSGSTPTCPRPTSGPGWSRAWVPCSASGRSAPSPARTCSRPGRRSCAGSATTSAPVVLVVDDAQHADEGLLGFLEYLLGVGGFPCLVVLLARPGLLAANPALATHRRASVLHLDTLADKDMAALLDGLVAGLPDGDRDALVRRAEGIPLYAVETVRSLVDRDLVVPRGGQYVLADADVDLDSVGAPASLQALIAARLDALPADERRLLDFACVLGTSFERDVIAQLCPEIPDLDAVLGLARPAPAAGAGVQPLQQRGRAVPVRAGGRAPGGLRHHLRGATARPGTWPWPPSSRATTSPRVRRPPSSRTTTWRRSTRCPTRPMPRSSGGSCRTPGAGGAPRAVRWERRRRPWGTLTRRCPGARTAIAPRSFEVRSPTCSDHSSWRRLRRATHAMEVLDGLGESWRRPGGRIRRCRPHQRTGRHGRRPGAGRRADAGDRRSRRGGGGAEEPAGGEGRAPSSARGLRRGSGERPRCGWSRAREHRRSSSLTVTWGWRSTTPSSGRSRWLCCSSTPRPRWPGRLGTRCDSPARSATCVVRPFPRTSTGACAWARGAVEAARAAGSARWLDLAMANLNSGRMFTGEWDELFASPREGGRARTRPSR